MSSSNPAKRAKPLVVTLAVLVALTAPVAGSATAVAPPDDGDQSYSIVQGDQCATIEPFGDGSQSVEEFYDYRTPETEPSSYLYGSFGTRSLQRNDVSSLFLYEGSEGTSLVVVHDRLEGETPGGAATMSFEGLPADGEWAVEDDSYSQDIGGGPDDEFVKGETSSRVTWTYAENRTDGGAFRGIGGDDTEVTIEAAFNDDAEFTEYSSRIDGWEVVSPSDSGNERLSLDPDQPVYLVSGDCSSHTVTDLTVNESLTAGETAQLNATVVNDGAQANTFNVSFTVDGEVVDERNVSLERNERTEISTTVTFDTAGNYTVGAGNTTDEVTVEESRTEDGTSTDEELPGFGVLAALLAMSVAAALRYRR